MRRIIALTLTLLLLASTTQAAITFSPTGCYPNPYVIPWMSDTTGILGAGGNGTATIDSGSTVTWGTLNVGWHTGYTGTCTVTGTGSQLTLNTDLANGRNAGQQANGIINILNGGNITVNHYTQLAGLAGTQFALTVDNATLDTQLVQVGLQGTASATLQNGAIWNSAGDRFTVANSTGANGTLAMTDSTLNLSPSLGFIFGNSTGTSSTLTMDNSTINYTSAASGYLGHIGDCTMTLTNGAVADFTGDPASPTTVSFGCWGASDATASLSGSSSLTIGKHFYIAKGNRSSNMTVQDGSTLTAGGFISIGNNTRLSDWTCMGVESHAPADQLHGNLTVAGSGSSANVGTNLYVGSHINGDSYPHSIITAQLDIDSSAQVNVTEATLVGSGIPNVSATLDMDGGTLNTHGLGADMANITGTGTINTSGIVTNTTMIIDEAADLVQTINNGSVAINLSINGTGVMGAGYDGTGSLTVSGGVTVISTKGMLGHCMGANGTATVTGSGTVWETTGTLTVGGMGTGGLLIENGAMVKAAGLVIDADVAAATAGDLDEYYYYVGYSGTYSGDPADQFDVTADSVIRIAGGGMLALPGNLTVGGISDFLDAIEGSDRIECMDASGAWVDINSVSAEYYLAYDSGMGYTVLVTPDFIPPWPPDPNHDGKIDSSDLAILANNWQAGVPGGDPSVTLEKGDLNDDDKVDSSDLALLANNWQYGVSLGGPTAVPEPSMLILFFGALLAGWGLRKR